MLYRNADYVSSFQQRLSTFKKVPSQFNHWLKYANKVSLAKEDIVFFQGLFMVLGRYHAFLVLNYYFGQFYKGF